MRKSQALGSIALVLAACGGGGGGGPTGNGDVPAVAGTYQATFTAVTATPGCQNLVRVGDMTTGTLVVTQAGSSVTLRISDLREEFVGNPQGTLSSSGVFHFGPGAIPIDPTPGSPGDEFSAEGTFDGTFSGNAMNISFDFTALEVCRVTGTIVGQR